MNTKKRGDTAKARDHHVNAVRRWELSLLVLEIQTDMYH
mgnify:CR=1 FL=1